jgi:hypothetical protein
MLRYRAVELREGRIPLQQRELVKTDRNGRWRARLPPWRIGRAIAAIP